MGMVSCAIALGSNLGDSRCILQDALTALDATEGITVLTHSRFYETAPVGPPQPDYLNCSVLLQTCLAPEALLRELLQIEASFGRVRRERWGPRLLDLDLILFGDLVLTTPTLQIPHPRMHERAFVLVPLAEVAPDWVEPISGKTIAQLVEQVDCSGVHLLGVKGS
ncbi:2-amino-4-hydroxy-6-hydroxymethyldihydropteridine diphosphokinase [Pseudanabaena sp. FACHB-2040]|uniref:2-amino-4-hydroxy-6- hydroxymethyldihydropteridine diphosphokinase n=1 Tax=Pseudanabaena sp. FACHB-2040 TaxID=2692859 RepID=UPI0016843273|nr:2-amino-4-hydroxy-6-hydroxymethyldihydropteridine diphosphokinase [Pseudanabaena sp. FACHB-2040]MBD2256850.1 2-amino-4-hydroxy-6-hydroxymethyldihydropteridine diphosphokinase [Pseudanabaena sp. FACHB-2040]